MPVKNEYSNGGLGDAKDLGHLGRMKNLKAIRLQKQISQVQLAALAETTQGTISKIEKGDMNVTLCVIEKVAKALGVTPVELFGLEEVQQRALIALAAMSDEDRPSALVVLEAMAKKNPDRR